MISVATLGRKYRLASEIMNAYPDAVVAYPALMTTITFPLSPAETNILLAMQAETRYQLATIRDMSLRGRFLEDSFFEGMPGPPLRAAFAAGGFRPNATTNDLYLVFKEALDLLTKSPKEIFDGHQAMLARQEKMMGLTSGAIFFNLVGRAVTMRGSPDLPPYAFRVADLIGFSRLIDLQRRIIEGNVAVDKVGAALAVVGPVLMDPYTEKPMQWDATTKRVSFVTRGKRYPMFGYVTLEHFK
jgi:hypothetical protein